MGFWDLKSVPFWTFFGNSGCMCNLFSFIHMVLQTWLYCQFKAFTFECSHINSISSSPGNLCNYYWVANKVKKETASGSIWDPCSLFCQFNIYIYIYIPKVQKHRESCTFEIMLFRSMRCARVSQRSLQSVGKFVCNRAHPHRTKVGRSQVCQVWFLFMIGSL